MQKNPEKLTTHADLRLAAEDKLRDANAPEIYDRAMGGSSLMLLYRLASDPDTAIDALKLLHELQVHQVELDLQYEHMNEASQVLEQSVHSLTALFASAPVAYFVVTLAGKIAEANLAGACMLDVEVDDVDSENIVRLASPDSRASLLELFERVHVSGRRLSCRVQALDTAKRRELEFIASAAPDTQHCLVVVMEVSDPPPTDL